jgi:hypothetical protein
MGLAERTKRARNERGDRGGKRADPDPAGAQPTQRLQVTPGRVETVEDRLGVGEQALPLLGEYDATREPVEHLGTELMLEHSDLPGDRGLGEAQFPGGSGDRTVAGDGTKDLERLDLHGVHARTEPCERAMAAMPIIR